MGNTVARKSGLTRSNGDRTRQKITDAAEHLFGQMGFDAVSLREITQRAEVTLALASYHFGSKENLFYEVVARRAVILSAERQSRLRTMKSPDVRQLLDAFMSPLFHFAQSGETGWTDYFRIVGRLGETDRWLHLLADHFDETARMYIDALRSALPGADDSRLVRSFAMSLQIMLAVVSQNRRVNQLAHGQVKAEDLAATYPILLDYATAGFLGTVRPA